MEIRLHVPRDTETVTLWEGRGTLIVAIVARFLQIPELHVSSLELDWKS